MIKDRRKRAQINIILHTIAWLLLFSLPVLLKSSYHEGQLNRFPPVNSYTPFIASGISNLLLVGFFYLNVLLLIPRLMYKKKYAAFGFAICISFLIFIAPDCLLSTGFSGPRFFIPHKFFLQNIFSFLFITACSTAYKMIRDKIYSDRIADHGGKSELETKLSRLRSHISPNFIFNVLNGMVVIARKHSDQLEPSLIKLSSLMRYMLSDTENEKLSLQKETEYLQSYIALQQQRLGQKVIVNATMYHPDKEYSIEPMLLIPIVENAFTHGTNRIDSTYIEIDMKAENDVLFLSFINRYEPGRPDEDDATGSVSFSNLKKRLALLYPNKHTLNVIKDNRFFTGLLTIELN